MLSKREIAEIIAFDRSRRMAGSWDSRRYGSYTGAHAPMYTEAWVYARGQKAADGDKPPTRKTLRYNYIQPVRTRGGKRGEVRVIHVAVRLNRQYKPLVKDVARIRTDSDTIEYRDLGYHGIGGWVVYWDRKDYETKFVNAWMRPPALEAWAHEKYRRGGALTFPWHETINPGALKGTNYEWCQWPGRNGVVDWLKLYRAEPRIELLAKMGLADLCTPQGVKAAKKPEIRDYIRTHLDELRTSAWTVKAFTWAASRGLPVAEGMRHYEIIEEFRRHTYGVPKVSLDYERLRKMLPKWKAEVREYARYLTYCERAGLDMKCEGVLYPPVGSGETSFHARLERIEADCARAEERRRRAARRRQRLEQEADERKNAALLAERHREIAAFQMSLDKSAVLDLGDGVKCVLAKDQKTLLAEGRKMNNCVGMGTYGRGVLVGTRLILMFRKDGEPFVDAEIDRSNWTVRQCYARGNRAAPPEFNAASERVAAFLKRECAKLKRRNRKSERRAS